MIVSLLILAVVASGGAALTYIFIDDEPLMYRLAAGNVVGAAVFGTLAFVASSFAGFNPQVVLLCLALILLPFLVFRKRERREALRGDWRRAKGKLSGANARKAARFAYYLLFFILFAAFFSRAMFENEQGIFTGGSQNLGDLPFHLGAIFSFTEGLNFPPQNPSFAGSRFSYPFIADFLTSCFMRLGSKVDDAMFVQNVSWAFSLLVILERFVFRLTADAFAARIGPALLFFSGGLGFLAFFSDYAAQGRSFVDFIWQLPTDYTIGDQFRWGNSMVVMFITQRSLLLGMPLALVVLVALWKIFAAPPPGSGDPTRRQAAFKPCFPIFVVGMVAGLLPLIHLHSLGVLFVVGVFLFILQPEKWLYWAAFAAGVAVVAAPEMLWSLAGSASETSKFVGWNFGWDKRGQNFVWFWFLNTGLFIPTALGGMYLSARFAKMRDTHLDERPLKQGAKRHAHAKAKTAVDGLPLLLFSLPFIFLFIVSNTVKLAPWEWDNIKVLIYWFVGLIPFAALLIARLWRASLWGRVAAATVLLALTFSGALDVWRTATRQISIKVFDRDAITLAERLKRSTAPQAKFLNAPTYNSAVVLTGRLSLMRYTGHLSSHGIDYAKRESDVREIYRGGPAAEDLLRTYGVNYVLVSPEERGPLQANEQFFAKFPIIAEAGAYRVYRIQ